ncbi:hypothetical protein JCM8208_005725 [Rhodotorula glutinis]
MATAGQGATSSKQRRTRPRTVDEAWTLASPEDKNDRRKVGPSPVMTDTLSARLEAFRLKDQKGSNEERENAARNKAHLEALPALLRNKVMSPMRQGDMRESTLRAWNGTHATIEPSSPTPVASSSKVRFAPSVTQRVFSPTRSLFYDAAFRSGGVTAPIQPAVREVLKAENIVEAKEANAAGALGQVDELEDSEEEVYMLLVGTARGHGREGSKRSQLRSPPPSPSPSTHRTRDTLHDRPYPPLMSIENDFFGHRDQAAPTSTPRGVLKSNSRRLFTPRTASHGDSSFAHVLGGNRKLLKVDEAAPEVTTKPKKRKFPTMLAPEDAARVEAIYNTPHYVSNTPGATAALKDVKGLKGLSLLNDELVNFIGVLVNQRSNEADTREAAGGSRGEGEKKLRKAFVFNTNFFTIYSKSGFAQVKEWTKRFDTFAKDIIIVPINHNNLHWTCAAVNVKLKRFEYYDSLAKRPAEWVYERLRKWLVEEHRHRKKSEIDLSDWTDYWNEDVPQQQNASDCGVFTCMFMESLSREVNFFDFKQKNMPYLRRKMVLQIDKCDLLDVEPWV